MKPHEKVQLVLKELEGVGGVPSDQEFYDEFHFRLCQKLEIAPLIRIDFVHQMSRELLDNADKGDWREWHPSKGEALSELGHHINKLKSVLEGGEEEKITEHTADIANICMKIDKCFGRGN